MSLTFILRNLRPLARWHRLGWSNNAPQFVKEAIFRKYSLPGATWVETGTFRGKTTQFLSRLAKQVYTIEPAQIYFEKAAKKFAGSNIEVINGASEDVFPDLLPKLSGDICFWLDGHYSAGATFKGATDCPVEQELAAIDDTLNQFGKVSILIDDIRLFVTTDAAFSDYPSIDFLVDWARSHGFSWRVEQDIFILTNWS